MGNWLRMKEPINTWTHLIPCLVAIVSLIVISIKTWDNIVAFLTMNIYLVCGILLFAASTCYHWLKTTPRKELLLRKLDHMAIYLKIAGTYTPILVFGLQGAWRWGMLIAIWSLAITGMILKIWFVQAPRKLTASLYLILGWLAVIPLVQLIRNLPLQAIILLFAGGIAYSVGAVIYSKKALRLPIRALGFHEVFHLFVALGSALHFVMIVGFVVPI